MKRAFSISIILLLVRASRNSNIMRPTTFDPKTLRQYLLRRHLLADFLHLEAHTVARGRQQLLDGDVTSGGPDATRRRGPHSHEKNARNSLHHQKPSRT